MIELKRDLPRHLHIPVLNGGARKMFCFIADMTTNPQHGGHVASWHISRALPWSDDLDVKIGNGMPGTDAMNQLKRLGLVEDVPDLGCRYRLTALGCALWFAYLANGVDVSWD